MPSPKNAERRTFRIDLAGFRADDKAAADADAPPGLVLSGYAAKFNLPSEDLGGFREFIKPGAFTASIDADDIRALIDHNPTLILGRNTSGTLRLSEDATGLHFELDLPDTGPARDLRELIRRGDVSGCSFGFVTIEDIWTNENGEVRRDIITAQLFDVSIVTYPAYPDTEVAIRSLTDHRTRTPATTPTTPLRDAAHRWIRAKLLR